MKNKVLIYCFVFMLPIYSLICQDITTGLIAWWSFDDSTARDHSGNGYHGTLMNTPKPVQGIKGTAFRLQGRGINTEDGDHILLPEIDFNSMSEFTVSIWVWEEGFSEYGPSEGFIWWGDWNSGWLGIHHHCQQQPHIDNTKQFIRFSVGAKIYESECYNQPFDSSDMFKWVLYTMTYKNGLVECYKNDRFIGSIVQNVSVAKGVGAIGRHWWNDRAVTSTRLIGIVDDARIYNRALTKDDIKKLATKCNNGLIAYWSFEDSTARDFSGNGYNGKLMNSPNPVIGHDGKGTAMHFQGRGVNSSDGDHIILPMIDFKNLNEFSVSLWAKWEGFSIPHGDDYLWFGDWDNGWLGITNHYNHVNPPEKTWINFAVGSHLHDNQISVEFNPNLDSNKWVFYCMTHSNGITKAYIDGKLVGTKAQTVDIYGNWAGLNRSWWADGAITSTRFTGALDDVKIYCKALTDKEVDKEWNHFEVTGRTHWLCEDDTLTIFAEEGYSTYQWSTGETSRTIIVNKPGEYSATATNNSGDTVKSSFYVYPLKKPVPTIVVNKKLCKYGFGELEVNGIFKSILWSNLQTSKIIRVLSAGKYSVVVTDSNGCQGYAEIQLEETVPEQVKITIHGTKSPCIGELVELMVQDSLFGYLWYHNLSGTPFGTAKRFAVQNSGLYYYTAFTKDSCLVYSDTIDINFSSKENRIEILSAKQGSEIIFDTTYFGMLTSKTIKLRNTSQVDVLMDFIYLKSNTEFSIPQTQLPMNFTANETKDLTIYLLPGKLGKLLDTLVIYDNCSDNIIPFRGFCSPTKYEAQTLCNAALKLMTRQSPGKHSIVFGTPYPNPAGIIINIPFSRTVTGKSNIRSLLINLLGTVAAIGELESSYVNSNENISVESGKLTFKTANLQSGIYFILISIEDETVTYPVFIQK